MFEVVGKVRRGKLARNLFQLARGVQRSDYHPGFHIARKGIGFFAEWGNLPPRTRDMVQQGVREKMSSVYRRWTEAYYRRIAEEAKR